MNTRISKYAKIFRTLFWCFLVASPFFVALFWLSGGLFGFESESYKLGFEIFLGDIYIGEEFFPEFPLAWDIRMFGLAVNMLPLSVSMLSLWWLIRLFDCFTIGEIFTENTVKYIRYLGWTMVAGVAVTPIYDALITLVLTMHNDVGERLIAISFEGTDFEELITAGVIILVSWIMEEGRKLRETDELTV